MLYTGQTYEEGNKPSKNYAEMWNIMQYPTKGIKMPTILHQELAPSKELYSQFMNLKKEGKWNADVFNNWFVPEFIKGLDNDASKMTITNLFTRCIYQDIILLCACKYEDTCHRSIIKGILAGMYQKSKGDWRKYIDAKYPVNTKYYDLYAQITNHKGVM